MTSILIASPTPGTVKTDYMKAIIGTIRDLARRNIKFSWDTADGSDVPFLRNLIATRFLQSQHTHLFCVDSDMVPPLDLCFRLLEQRKDVIGAVYCRKELDFAKVDEGVRRGLPLAQALMLGLTWIVDPDPRYSDDSGPSFRVRGIGAGALLVSKSALQKMVDTKAAIRVRDRPGEPETFSFFSMRAESAQTIGHVSEDMSFCHRWIKDCGGEVWALRDAPVAHIGDFYFTGSYGDAQRLGASAHPLARDEAGKDRVAQ